VLRFFLFTTKRALAILSIITALCSWQVFLLTSSVAAATVSDQVGELLRQQIEAWNTPPVEAAPTPSTTTLDGNPDALVTSAPQQSPDFENAGQPAPETLPSATPAERISKATPPKPKLTVGTETLRTAAMLARFYQERQYRPAWSDETGPHAQADILMNTIHADAAREGLQVGAYRLTKLSKLLQDIRSQKMTSQAPAPRSLADLDLLLTDTFLTYTAHLSVGKTNLDAMDAHWFEQREKTDLPQALQAALDANRLGETLKALSPQHASYGQLRDALARYRDIAARGGWPSIPTGFDLRPGDHDERVMMLRTRLQITGDLKGSEASATDASSDSHKNDKKRSHKASGNNEYDSPLVQAVKAFQRRHGLGPDGVVGGGTLAILNVPVETRIQQILVNMERWRILPQDLGKRRIEVNIPNFTLDVVDNERSAMQMKVVVGKMLENRNTPAFTAKMTHVVLNPFWHVPKSIAEGELFPLSRKNPRYFSDHKFIVRRIEVGEKQVPAPNASDGSTVSTKVYKYLLKQAPGPKNALGRIKFIFPNPHGIYLHDTPSKDLFNRTVRTYSHGCIRVEKPVDLAEYLLHEKTKWTRESILSTISQQKEKTVWLPEAVPVYIQYWTAWVDTDGTVQFRNDIYGYDDAPRARLPITLPKNPRPEPILELQPPLQEAQPIAPTTPLDRQTETQPAPPVDAPPGSPTETHNTL
jgi:L,D-transpeptidase YcbB